MNTVTTPRDIVILGSTGSIGTQALDVVRANPDRFRVVALAAAGSDPAGLARQALEFDVDVVAVSRATAVQDVQLAMYAAAQAGGYSAGEHRVPKILSGADAATQAAALPCDLVLNGITGATGLRPTIAALGAGSTLALANKESLIMGGDVVMRAAAPGQIVPVDSEHSALAQCLRAGRFDEVRRLVLTASGGPFRGRTRDDLVDVTPEQALEHPTWDMGPVITVNCATLVNKGLELIEAHLLFGVDFDRLDVVVHPQSVVHSMVEFIDGSTLVQASPPDMRLPIALALGWPDRLAEAAPACDWGLETAWEFAPLDHDAFPAVRLAAAAGQAGGTAPAVFNAANEVCVGAFLARRLAFTNIVDTVAAVMERHDVPSKEQRLSIDDVLEADAWARECARGITGLEDQHASDQEMRLQR
jgi:1-deoxy-D-xylulose-5-phosphate reductoisomerase